MLDLFNGMLTLAFQDGDAATEATDAATQAAETATDAAQNSGINSTMGIIMLLAAILLVVIGPFVVGAVLSGILKVKEWGFRFGVALFALTLGLAPFASHYFQGDTLEESVRLGIDLAGGTNMVFQVQKVEGKEITGEVMDRMVGAVSKRINLSGTEEITVRPVGANRIEVIVPGEDPQTVDDIKRRITKLGSLEFYITAHQSEESAIVAQARQMSLSDKKLLDGKGEVIAMWLPAFEKDGEPQYLGFTNQAGEFIEKSDAIYREIDLTRSVDGKSETYKSREYLVIVGPKEQQITGKYLVSAMPGVDPERGAMVSFRFNQRGAFLFGRLTAEYQPRSGHPDRSLAIVLDKHIYSAPTINSVITDNGQITGDFTAEETKELSDVLNAGALEVPIDPKPLSEATVDPTLGEDVRNKGVQAIAVASIVVVLFMIVYYRFAGLVAVFCLGMNLVLVLGTMMLINATFTLPGLAGLVLTIGMAVDANVLIFERMREELNRGSSLRMAIQNGFAKAFSTIVDANVTTLITAVILFMIGTDQIRGFAVTLFIGIVMSMFTALYVGRLIFDVAEKKNWVRKLGMFSLVGETNWNFVGKRAIAAVVSVVLIGIGLAAFFNRGEENYDIDFTGGTMVTFQLTEPAETDAVQAVLSKEFPENFTLERLTLAGEDTTAGGKHFRLRTTESDSEETEAEELSAEERVSGKVNAAFEAEASMNLLKVSMSYGDLTPIEVAEDDESAEARDMRRFNGGNSVDIEFADGEEVAIGTISDNLAKAIGAIQEGSQAKYGEPLELIQIVGLEGSGTEAGERQVRKYSKVTATTTAAISAEDLQTALAGMKAKLDSEPLFDEVNTFASAVASEMKQSAVLAIIISLIAIVGYIWFRFQKITFGFAAVVALVHDVLVVLGMVALASHLNGSSIGEALLLNDFRINLPMVAAFLTIVGYSLNDTIVVFDRIREVRGKNPELTAEIVNTSLNQTLSRTLLTSLTTFLVVIILYCIGGEGIHGFAFCLTLGVLVGTYSSIYVASPVLIWLMNRENKAG